MMVEMLVVEMGKYKTLNRVKIKAKLFKIFGCRQWVTSPLMPLESFIKFTYFTHCIFYTDCDFSYFK